MIPVAEPRPGNWDLLQIARKNLARVEEDLRCHAGRRRTLLSSGSGVQRQGGNGGKILTCSDSPKRACGAGGERVEGRRDYRGLRSHWPNGPARAAPEIRRRRVLRGAFVDGRSPWSRSPGAAGCQDDRFAQDSAASAEHGDNDIAYLGPNRHTHFLRCASRVATRFWI